MRLVSLLFAALLLTASAPPQVRDWRGTLHQAPSGAYVEGNPDAKVKLVEYLSYTCSHCAHFVTDSKPVLKGEMVRSGQVSVEFRNAVRDALDLTAALAARCAGPENFLAAHEALFASQASILEKAQALTRNTSGTLAERLNQLADGSGISAIVAKHGVTGAELDACLADQAETKKLLAMTEQAFGRIRGTPSFEIDGTLVPESHDWGSLAPHLKAAIDRHNPET